MGSFRSQAFFFFFFFFFFFLGFLFAIAKVASITAITGGPDSQPTGGRIIWLCIGIYRKIENGIEMQINSHLSVHTSLRDVAVLFSYCFWPYKQGTVFFPPFLCKMDEGGSPGTPVNLVCIGTFFPCPFLLGGGGGDFERAAWQLSQEPSNGLR